MHPNDVVNASQSSNDVFPTSIHLAAAAQSGAAISYRRSAPGRDAGRQGGRMVRGREGRPYASDGRHAGHARAGVLRLRGADPLRHRAVAAVLPRVAELPLGGTAVGTGVNTPPGFAAAVIGSLAAAYRPSVDRGAQPLRGARCPRRVGRSVRTTARDRGRTLQDRERHPMDGFRSPGRPSGAAHPRSATGLVDHARQGEPRGL